uniref:Cysteine-rich motor neuron 1 protein n=1 Tax=Rhabditophanes sp. KR3021 TaxID=114890 RepID=A0AC35UI37_9BILA
MDAQYTCPEDSFRPASYVPENSCCPINPGCRCRESICQPAFCGESETLVILSKSDGSPGKCCDKFICTNTTISGYESKDFKIIKAKKAECVDNGNIYQEGTQFLKTSCNVCVCRNGVIKCKHMDCEKPPHGCGWVGVPDTECCPVCLGCKTENSTYYNKNESWKRDDCTSCSCGDDGKSYCQTTTCMKTCENPRIEKGVCCPVCDEPTIISPPKNCPQLDCSLRCKQGLVKDTWGCYKCQCAESKAPFTNTYMYSDTDFGLLSSFESCQDFDGLTCDKQCAHGYVRNTKKCRTCKCEKCPELDQCFKQCLYGFEVNSQGCKICKCKTRELGDLSTSPSLTPSNSSCVIVADDSSLEIKDNGELWTDSNCRNCFCHYGVEFCSIITCPQKPASCDVWVKERGSCCPSCHGKESNESKHDLTVCYNPGTGRLYVDGETWYSTKLCTACTCRVGHVLCAPNDCPPVACENPVVDEMNNCCMRCPKENETNNSITHHQTLTVIANNQNGMYSPETLPAEFCVDEGRMAHLIGQTWKKDECTSCECSSDATIKCFKETCPKLSECKGKPLVVKGRCCEICSDIFSSEAICTYKKTPYKVNEEWKDGACTNCSCLQGSRTECLSLKCPACRDPIYVDNQCCPICREDSTSSDTYQHKYSNGLSTIVIIVTITVCLLLLGMTAFVGLMLYKKRNHATIKETLKTVHGANPQPHAYKPDRSSSIDDQTTESLLSDDGASTFGGNSSSRCSYERGHVFTDTLPLQAP